MAKQKKENQRYETQVHVDGEPSSERFGIDFEEFAHFFEGEDITEEQARAFLKIYWEIACEIMSLGFGFHPVQQAQKACGQLKREGPKAPLSAPDGVILNTDILTENFLEATGLDTDAGAEGVDK